tara:strand:+ start:266 stop:400 length:135 start_codon:yes stop_codon:yes gene_type:complete
VIKKEDLDQDPKEVVLDQETIMDKIKMAIFSPIVMETWVEIVGR